MKLGETLAERFELTSLLGRGAHGEVFSGRDLRTRRTVAIKVFDPAQVVSGGLSAMTRLLQAASRVAHPAVALPRVHLAFSATTPFVVGDLIEGEDLAVLATRDPLPWQRALDIMLACCDGLTALSSATGTAHRALKPGNVRVASDGSVHVLDFGVAELGILPVGARADGSVVEYRAPEQLDDATGDGASDVFTIGVLLFELITGSHPYSGPTSFKVGHKILTQKQAPKLSESAPGLAIPSQVEALVARALSRTPAERFSTPAELSQHMTLVRRSPGTLVRSRASVPHKKVDEEMTQTIAPSAPPEELTTMLNIPVARLLKGASSDSSEAVVPHAAQNGPQATPGLGSDLPREPSQVLPSLPSAEVPPVLPGVSDPELSERTSVLPRRAPAKATAVEPLEATVAFMRRPVERTVVDGARPAQRQSHLPDTTLELPTEGPVAEAPRRAVDMSADTEATSVLVRPSPTPRSQSTGSTASHEPTAFTPSTTDQQRENTLKRTFLILNVVCLLLVLLVVYFLLS